MELNTTFSEEEKRVLREYLGTDYEILSFWDGDCYALNVKGEYFYNECFAFTDNEFFAKRKYEKVIPWRLIKFYQYYFLNTEQESAIWFKGERNANGNLEFLCYSDSLAEALECL